MAKKILIVDDERDYVALLGEILTTHGYEVSLAYDGQQAIDMVSKDKPDLIILDIKMPRLNGWEVSKFLSNDTRYNNIPFLMLTACNDVDDIKSGMRLGAISYIAKPFKQEVLLALVDGLMNKKSSTENNEA